MAANNDIMDMWESNDFDVSGTDSRRAVPELPRNPKDYSAYTGPVVVPALAALTALKGGPAHKKLIVELVTSAVAAILNDVERNYTGSRIKPVVLTGDDVLMKPPADTSVKIKTNIAGLPDITIAEWLLVSTSDPDELSAYIGTLVYAACKKPTKENIDAFGAKRASAATAGVIGDPFFYAKGSDFVAYEVMQKVHASFTSHAVARANMISMTVSKIPEMAGGAQSAFGSQFLLLRNHGMSALAIVLDGLLHCAWIKEEFPELRNEFEAANRAFRTIRAVEQTDRPFIKAIHGNRFVPVNYSEITVLVGVCKSALTRFRLSYANYRGGSTTPEIEARIQKRLGNAMVAAPGGVQGGDDHVEDHHGAD